MSWLVSNHATERCGTYHRPPGLRTQCQRHHEISDARRRPAGGPPWRVSRVVWISGLARVHKSEFCCDRLTQHHSSRSARYRYARRIGCGAKTRINVGAIGGRHVVRVDDVLETDGHPMQRAQRRNLITRAGFRQGGVRIDMRPGHNIGFAFLDPVQTSRRQGFARNLTRRDGLRRLARTQFIQLRHVIPRPSYVTLDLPTARPKSRENGRSLFRNDRR